MAEVSNVEIKGVLNENQAPITTPGDEKRGSPPPQKAMPMKPKDPQMPLPASRPPSTTSIQSSSSNGAPPRTTTTSRRGGRTRSRSPPTMVNRPGSANPPEREFAEPLPPMDSRMQSQSPANPSSAAAAAAAAAKAFSITGGNRNPNQWYEGAPEGSNQRERRPEGSRYHPGYDKRYPGSRSWPGEEDPEGRRNYRSSRPREGEPDSRQYPPRGPYLADQSRSGSGSQGEGHHAPGRRQYEQQQYGGDYDGRYQESRGRGSFERDGNRGDQSGPPPYDGDRRHQRYGRRRDEPEEYYRGPGGMAPVAQDAFSPKTPGPREVAVTPSTGKRSGGTSRVIGTATPIHVPRAADPTGGHHPPAGTPASVFRGRPGDVSGRPAEPADSPQKILLSLRTPTTSFEEQQHSRSRKEGQAPLSPEEPPQIQHSHHQHQMEQSLFFEQPNRGSPKEAPVQASTLEMAPSFSLFNQSFDSLGDTAQYLNVSGALDGTFNAASFGAGPTASRDDTVAQLLPNPSGTNSFAAGERFLGSASGGMLTFGMSPVNSFGNGAPAASAAPSRRSGNMMVLGGPDQQPTSPTQMLSMYPSYSGGGYGSQGSQQPGPFRTRSGQMTDPNMRTMSSGSFGGSAMYSRSYEASPHGAYHPPSHDGQRSPDGPPGFYAFLGRNKAAFLKCSFLLPGLKAALLESPIDSKAGEEEKSRKLSLGGRRGRYTDPSPQDTAMSTRRVASAICAFGGCIMGDRANAAQVKTKENKQSIFREKEEGPKAEVSVTVTPSSSSGTPPGVAGQQPRMRHKYDELLPSRYYENENRLSWEFEETPPVGDDEESVMARKRDTDGEKDDNQDKEENSDDPSRILSSPQPNDPDKSSSSVTHEDDDDEDEDGKKGSSDQPKMRYRCKLCGLPKQNHTCAYQQSLQRSIGIMIYPAVNAFTSSEPGMLAPALSDMNNFVSQQGGDSSTETSPSRPTPDRARRPGQTATTPGSGAPNVTPETMRSSNSSSSSNASVGARTPLRSPISQKRKPRGSNMSGGAAMGQRVGTGSPPGSSSRKRTHGQMSAASEEDLLFVETTDLKPEQFRIVTPSKQAPGPDAYTYPSLPLPYAQRKRLSDNLFALSKEVPQLTDECAVVLREARERDMWDLAVAELMTQVVVVIHCHDNDTRFEGLRHYLLTLGIAC